MILSLVLLAAFQSTGSPRGAPAAQAGRPGALAHRHPAGFARHQGHHELPTTPCACAPWPSTPPASRSTASPTSTCPPAAASRARWTPPDSSSPAPPAPSASRSSPPSRAPSRWSRRSTSGWCRARPRRSSSQPAVGRMVVGQRLRMSATSYSAASDERQDKFTWRSSAPGRREGGRGRRRDRGGAGQGGHLRQDRHRGAEGDGAGDRQHARVGSSSRPRSADAAHRRRDRLQGHARRIAHGPAITGLTPTWSFSPGHGAIDADGAFVGYEAGRLSRHRELRRRRAPRRRSRSRRATCAGRSPSSAGCRAPASPPRKSGSSRRQARLPRQRAAAATCSTPSTSAIRPTRSVTDSIVLNTRRVNDVMTTPDGKFLVFTREGAADRKNGIVIARLDDPAHPEGDRRVHRRRHRRRALGVRVQAGEVRHPRLPHQRRHRRHARHRHQRSVPAEGSRAVAHRRGPTPAARCTTSTSRTGCCTLSYWNDGLVILDVGNGIKGGTPSQPACW